VTACLTAVRCRCRSSFTRATRIVITHWLPGGGGKGVATWAVVALVALTACGAEDKANQPAKTPAKAKRAAATPVANELVGAWTSRFSARKLKQIGDPASTYTMKVTREGQAQLFFPGSPTADCYAGDAQCLELEIKANGSRLTIGESPACAGSGQYSYTLTRGRLTTKKVRDDCTLARPAFFDRVTWRRRS
jgi:hypothetical protein